MATSERLLTGIAIRLAALVAVGLLAKAGAADHWQQAIACCVSERAVVSTAARPATIAVAEETLREMLLHD